MDFLRALLSPFDRRSNDRPVEQENRTSKYDKIKAANGRINSAIDDLDKTLNMSREEWLKNQQDQQK